MSSILIDLNKRGLYKYLLFSDLYFPEGLCNVLIFVLIPLYLLETGIPVTIITLISGIGSLPWIIKFIWSSPIDSSFRFGKKTFIINGGLIAILCFVILFFIDPSIYLIPFTIILFISQVGQSLLDSAADAWAIDVIKKDNRGKINSAMHIGMILGSGLSAIILSQIAQRYGYATIFLFAAIIMTLTLFIPLITREIKTVSEIQKVTSQLILEIKKKPVRLLLLYCSLFAISGGLLSYVIPIFANTELHFDVAVIGLISSVGTVITIPGAIFGGVLADRWERKKTLFIFGTSMIFLIFTFTLTRNIMILFSFYFIWVFIGSSWRNANFALFMDATNPKLGGVQFSLYNGLTNLGFLISGMISGFLVEYLNFNNVFIIASLALIPPLMILYFVRINK